MPTQGSTGFLGMQSNPASPDAKHSLLAHKPFELVLVAIPPFKYSIYTGVVDWPLLMVGKQILLAHISDIAVLCIFGEQMVKWLVLRRPHGFWDRLIPFLAIGKNRINVEHHATKIE